ncbi:MAG: heparinase II/III domain-containing protein [Armatimonadota bacterium]
MARIRRPVMAVLTVAVLPCCILSPAKALKNAGVLFNSRLLAKARANAAKYPWAAEIQQQIVDRARPWMKYSDDELWQMMFGPTIKRAWQVWSSGYCPSCKKSVPMYNWIAKALDQPWKMQCPHCKELFPKNDFEKFYRSGLDEHGIFNPDKADRSLLFNTEHPDPGDPLHKFGVDDGEGYVEGDNRWRFIGAYLIYGQWKQAVLGGIVNLAAAYAVTGNREYAHKAGVLLDRVADIYPSMDFGQQGVMYEGPPARGYVSTWHDACEETRSLALAYDQVFDALKTDADLCAFLARKARDYGIENPKATFADIQRNIEDNILRHAVDHRDRIYSNYPQTDLTIAVIKTVLSSSDGTEYVLPDEVTAILDEILTRATAVDGLTGEKGLAGYTAYSPQGMAKILGIYARVDPDFIKDACKRHPKLPAGYRFFIDTWLLGKYYPNVGDTGAFCRPADSYAGVGLTKNAGLMPSGYPFLWELYKVTGDPAFVQIIYRANNYSTEGLPYEFQRQVRQVIDRVGTQPRVGSVNKQEWHIAVLRSGKGAQERAVWLNYESGGGHGHSDGMNLGLVALGLDLMSDFGYPQVQYGGWGSEKSRWYMKTAAHNTVVVDGADQPSASGKTTLWADGSQFRAVRASCPQMIKGSQYERTVALIDVSRTRSYVFDVFRVVGGTDHTTFAHACYGSIATSSLSLEACDDYGRGALLRNSAMDSSPDIAWYVDWTAEDRYKVLDTSAKSADLERTREVHLRSIDLTPGAQALVCEAWVGSGFNATEETWIPCVAVRRQAQKGPLASTFVSLIEPYEEKTVVRAVRRLPLETLSGASYPDSHVAVEVALSDGRTDLIVAADVDDPLPGQGLRPVYSKHNALVQKEWGLRLQGEMCWVRRGRDGRIERIALCRGTGVTVGGVTVEMKAETEFVELDTRLGKIVSGGIEGIADLKMRGE